MGITLEQFYAKYPPGSRIDTDGFPKLQPYQCTDLSKTYLHEVFGMPLKPYGDASNYWTNPEILVKFDQIVDGSRREGDILVWGNDEGSWTGIAGHIAIWRGGKIYNQNYNGSGKISNNIFFNSGYLGALRKKGTIMSPGVADNYTVQALAEGGLGRTAQGDTNLLNNIGQPVNNVIDTFRTYPEWKKRQEKANNYDRDVKLAYERGKAEGSSGGNCTAEERAFLDSMYKIVTKK